MTSLYEVLFIVPTNISEEDFSELSNKLRETIEKKHSSEITKFEKWAERKLAYTINNNTSCLLYTSPSPRDMRRSRMPSSA